MVKSREDVVAAFNEYVNMNADELQNWLDDPKSTRAGTGVGLESGHTIIEILKKNPDKDPEKYDEVCTPGSFGMADVPECVGGHQAHEEGRQVRVLSTQISWRVNLIYGGGSYNARHLAQEEKLKETKTKEELEDTKSTIRYIRRSAHAMAGLPEHVSNFSLKNWGHVRCR